MNSLFQARQLALKDRLHDVSFALERGQVLGLLGINGAGKSTLLKAIAGVLPIDGGEILLNGQPAHAQSEQRIGWLPQQPPVYPEMSVIENLRFAAGLRRGGKTLSAAELDQQLQRFGLQDLRKRLAHRLSGGERMRLGLACTLVDEPAVLLLDEPTAGLDVLQAEQLRKLITELAQERAIILASHLLPDIEQLCQRAVLLHNGRVVAEQDLQADSRQMLAEFSFPPSDEALLAIPGIKAISSREDKRLLLQLSDDAPPIMPEKLACHGWGLRRWQAAPNDLVARFRELSSGERL